MIENINKYLTVYECENDSLIRLGPHFDGGYVVPEKIIKNENEFFTIGVGDNTDFEDDLFEQTNFQKEIHLFDHTIPESPYCSRHLEKYDMNFIGIGSECKDNLQTLDKILEKSKTRNVSIKLDVEGCEYNIFQDFSDETENRVDCLILELHDVGTNYPKAIKLLEHFSKNFILVHKHISDWEEVYSYNDFVFANEYELTFVNKRLFSQEPKIKDVVFPIEGLDFPNSKIGIYVTEFDYSKYKEALRNLFDKTGKVIWKYDWMSNFLKFTSPDKLEE